MGDSTIRRFTSEDPCPICSGSQDEPRGNGTRCFGFLGSDGVFAHCSREEFAGEIEQHPEARTYPHMLVGECRCGTRHGEPSSNGHGKIVKTYDYVSPTGNLVHQVLRYEPKTFKQRHPDPDNPGQWIWSMKGVERVLYRLPDLIQARLAGEMVLVCEGEKDCDTAGDLGLVATTCAEGARKWQESYNPEFRGCDVVLLPDLDAEGREHMNRVADQLLPVARSMKILELPGLSHGGDLSDWVSEGGTREELQNLVEECPFILSKTIREEVLDKINLPFKTGFEIAESTPVITEWLAYPWFPKGTVIEVSGKIKIAGKTTWLTHAVAKILDGAPFMGGYTQKTKVIYLTEQSPNSFRRVIHAAKLERADVKVLYWHDARGVSWLDLIAAVGEESRTFDAGLIVIDVISRWASIPGLSESDAAYADHAMPPLKELAAKGFTVIYARHDRKSGGDVGESGRGSSQVGGDADQMFQLSVPPGANNRPNVRLLTNTGRFVDQTPHSVNIELVDGEYRSLGVDQDFARQNALKLIPEILPVTEEAAIKTEEVVNRAAAHGVKRTQCTNALKELSESGAISYVEDGGKKGRPSHRYFILSKTPPPIVLDKINEGVSQPRFVQDPDDLKGMISDLKTAPEIGLDLETYPRDETASSLDPRRGKVGVIILASRDATYVIDRKALLGEDILSSLRTVLSGKPLIAHNAGFDLPFLRRATGYEHDGPVFDTLVLNAMYFYATGPLAEKDHWRGFIQRDKESGYKRPLSEVAEKWLDLEVDKTEQLSDWGGELTEEMVSYAAEDARILLPLKETIIAELENLRMRKIVDLESRFTPAMTYAADNGFAIDEEAFKQHAAASIERRLEAKKACYALAPPLPEGLDSWVWNGSSHRKVGRALELLGAKVKKNPKTGHYKTSEKDLKAIKRPKKARDLAAAILRYREDDKYVSTYGESWFRLPEISSQGKTKGKIKQGSPDHAQILHGRVYTKLNQLVATGRGSSRSPNLQNIPPDLHQVFKAPRGRTLIIGDYKQMEYCAAAYVSGDETLLQPLREGADFHQATADMIGVDRSVAKMVNFALLYGMAPKSLGERLGVSTEKAKGFIEAIRSRAPGLASWCDEQVELANRATPYTKTTLGRIRLVDQRYSPYLDRWTSNPSQMLNSPIQGSCADGYKLAAAMLWERRSEFPGNPLLVNMIHDELVIEIDEDAAGQATPLVEEIMVEGMKAAFGPDIPVSVDITVSEAWVKD